jgi:hypothetical protein
MSVGDVPENERLEWNLRVQVEALDLSQHPLLLIRVHEKLSAPTYEALREAWKRATDDYSPALVLDGSIDLQELSERQLQAAGLKRIAPARPKAEGPLPWAKWPWQRCFAYREPRDGSHYHGRCELRRGHPGDHALERGFDTPRWSSDWTGY